MPPAALHRDQFYCPSTRAYMPDEDPAKPIPLDPFDPPSRDDLTPTEEVVAFCIIERTDELPPAPWGTDW